MKRFVIIASAVALASVVTAIIGVIYSDQNEYSHNLGPQRSASRFNLEHYA